MSIPTYYDETVGGTTRAYQVTSLVTNSDGSSINVTLLVLADLGYAEVSNELGGCHERPMLAREHEATQLGRCHVEILSDLRRIEAQAWDSYGYSHEPTSALAYRLTSNELDPELEQTDPLENYDLIPN